MNTLITCCVKRTEALISYQAIEVVDGYFNLAQTENNLAQLEQCHRIANFAELIMMGLIESTVLPLDPIE